MASSHLSYLPRSDVILDGKNYKAWSSTLRVHLRGPYLWGHIDDTRPVHLFQLMLARIRFSPPLTLLFRLSGLGQVA